MTITQQDAERRAHPFVEPDDLALGAAFLDKGYVIVEASDMDGLARIRGLIVEAAARALGLDPPDDPGAFLNAVQAHVTPTELNPFRLACIQALNSEPWVRPTYYRIAQRALMAVVGNELAMQRNLNLSIQLPRDDSSILPLHADVWDGDSPYEVVVWTPLVDCYQTKSMFILPRAQNAVAHERVADHQLSGVEDLYAAVESDMDWIDIKFGQILLFSQNLMHGNRMNVEETTRWSINCRFKSVMSPYAAKTLGEFFEPITLKPATKMGLRYRHPQGFAE